METTRIKMFRSCLGLSLTLMLLLPACSATLGETQTKTTPSYAIPIDTDELLCTDEKDEVNTLKERVDDLSKELKHVRALLKIRKDAETKTERLEAKLKPYKKKVDALESKVASYRGKERFSIYLTETVYSELVIDTSRLACRYTPRRVKEKWLDEICYKAPQWRTMANIFYSELKLLEALKNKWEAKIKLAQAKIALKKAKIAYEKASAHWYRLIWGIKTDGLSTSLAWLQRRIKSYKKDLNEIRAKLAKFMAKYGAEFKPLKELAKSYKVIEDLPGEKDPTRQMVAKVKKALTKFRKHRSKPLEQFSLSLYATSHTLIL